MQDGPTRHPRPLRRGAACQACRRSKQACDAGRPACGPCILRKRECTYATFVGPVRKRQQKVLELENQLNERSVSASGSARLSPSESPSPPATRTGSPSVTSGTSSNTLLRSITSTEPPDLSGGFPSQMLQRFLPYCDHFALDIDTQHWAWTISLPASHPASFHPCLVNAICLIGCSLDPKLPKEWERHFYGNARTQMQLSLSLCDRIEDWLYATVVLIGYLLFRGRPLGMVELSHAAIPIAIACNLHLLNGPTNYLQQPYGLLPTPRDSLHANERINLWWALWLMDKRGALALEIPQAFPYRDTEAITTPMPISRNAIVTVGLKYYPWKTLKSTILGDHSSMDASADSVLGLRVKSTFILSESIRAANGLLGKKDVRDWVNISTLDKLIGVFIDSMPRGENTYSTMSNVPFKPLLARTTLLSLCAAIIIYTVEIDKVSTYYGRRLAAARWMAAIHRELGTYALYPYRDICNAPFWACGRMVLEKEIERTRNPRAADTLEASNLDYIETLKLELGWMNSYLYSENQAHMKRNANSFDL